MAWIQEVYKEGLSIGFELKNKLFSKRFLSKSFVDKDGILKDFNLPKETKIETTVLAA